MWGGCIFWEKYHKIWKYAHHLFEKLIKFIAHGHILRDYSMDKTLIGESNPKCIVQMQQLI